MDRPSGDKVRIRDLFADREFSALYLADVFSRGGSHLGRFALATLVYNRTGSPGLTAATIGISYLPGLLGGPILSTLADRLPRRGLLAVCDVARAVLVAAIALLGMPIVAALAILLLVELIKVPFGATRMAILADILEGERFTVGNALVSATGQVLQVAGFGLGGFVVIVLGSDTTLLVNAGTYLVSAHILLFFVTPRPAPIAAGAARRRILSDTAEGFRIVRDTARLPPLFWLLVLGPAVLITAEGLAIPYTRYLHLGDQWAGIFMAAAPLGTAVGLSVMARMAPSVRERLLIPASLSVGMLVGACGLTNSPLVITGLLFCAGLAMGHVAHLQALIVSLVASYVRGRVIGLANTGLQISQAVPVVFAGVIAENTSVAAVFLGAGLAGSSAVLVGAILRSPHGGKHRASPRQLRRERRREEPTDETQQLRGQLVSSTVSRPG